MTRAPRIALVLLAVQLLQLLVPGASAECARAMVAAGVETHHSGGHAGHDAPAAGHTGEERGERPVPPHCAVAPACAGAAVTVAVVSIAPGAPQLDAVVRAPDQRLPSSPVGTPEPPPPRG